MKRERLQGIVGTVVIHVIVLFILLFVYMDKMEPQEESGVSVVLGDASLSQGDADPYTLTEIDILDDVSWPRTNELAEPEAVEGQEMITQDLEETVAIEPKKETETVQPERKDTEKPEKTPEQLEAEQRAAAEKAAAEAAAKQIAGAFGRGSSMGNRGTTSSGQGIEGSPAGNSDIGKSTGAGGIGSWDLNGRSLFGTLPVPRYDVQEEGRVVVTITVNPAGRVINTSINKRTNTMSTALRRAAEEAARQARFNLVEGVDNQTGTITYYFKLR